MKRAFVTGASGFIGSAVVRALLADSVEVRALIREGADRITLEGLEVETVTGDLNDVRALARGLVGCDVCFHVAGMNRLWLRDRREVKEIYEVNDRGAERVLRIAADAGCERIVHTSSVAIIGRPPAGRHANEEDQADESDFSVHYQRSKLAGERRAFKLAEGGAPVVIVNPSAPMGPFDVKPTPTGRVVLDFLRGKMPGYMETGLNVIDVDDCARGHILAAEKGVVGQRYILGHENLSILEIFLKLARITGLKPPGFKVPRIVALMAAFASEVGARFTGRPPRVPLAGVRMAMEPMYYDNTKALEQLGLPTRPVEETLRRAAEWFIEHGYAEKPPAWKDGLERMKAEG